MKKRSLIAATAMLLVAVMVATTATYAWFTSNTQATANVSMGVATGSSLEISLNGTDYKTSLTADEITAQMTADNTNLTPKMTMSWSDFSTSTDDFGGTNPAFYSEVDANEDGVIDSYKADTTITKVTIYFRSTSKADVKLTTDSAFTFGADATLDSLRNAARVAIDSNREGTTATHTILSTQAGAGAVSNTIQAADLDSATGTGSYTATDIASGATVIAMTQEPANGYYYGTATFYFFIEGTLADNGSLAGATNIGATLQFTQQ